MDCLIQEGQLTDDVTVRSKVRRALLSNHEHQGEKRGRNKSVGGEEMKRRKSSSIFEKKVIFHANYLSMKVVKTTIYMYIVIYRKNI